MHQAAGSIGATACIAEAAKLVRGNEGAADRLLTRHRPGRDGRCAGCGRSMQQWPCVLVAIAHRSRDLAVTDVRLPEARL